MTLADEPWQGLDLEMSHPSGNGEAGNEMVNGGRGSRPPQEADSGLGLIWDERRSTFDVSIRFSVCTSTQLTTTRCGGGSFRRPDDLVRSATCAAPREER